eukprot:2309097-Pyramimonas_sp.AAC.1
MDFAGFRLRTPQHPGGGSDGPYDEMDFCAPPRYSLGVHLSGPTAWFRLPVSCVGVYDVVSPLDGS